MESPLCYFRPDRAEITRYLSRARPCQKSRTALGCRFLSKPLFTFYAAGFQDISLPATPALFRRTEKGGIPPAGGPAESIPLFSIFDRVGHEILFDHQSHLEDDGIVKFPEI